MQMTFSFDLPFSQRSIEALLRDSKEELFLDELSSHLRSEKAKEVPELAFLGYVEGFINNHTLKFSRADRKYLLDRIENVRSTLERNSNKIANKNLRQVNILSLSNKVCVQECMEIYSRAEICLKESRKCDEVNLDQTIKQLQQCLNEDSQVFTEFKSVIELIRQKMPRNEMILVEQLENLFNELDQLKGEVSRIRHEVQSDFWKICKIKSITDKSKIISTEIKMKMKNLIDVIEGKDTSDM